MSGTESLVRDQVDALAARSAALQALPDTEQQAIAEATATVLQFLANVPVEAGSRAAADITGEVAFPEFVRGLIEGVFDANVNASIKQMEAYGDLIKSVASEVDQFSKEPAAAAEGQTSDWSGVTINDQQRVADVLAAGINRIAATKAGARGPCDP